MNRLVRRRAIVAHHAETLADRWVKAEVHYFVRAADAADLLDPVATRRAEKARRRAVRAGDLFADALSRAVDRGLVAFAADLAGASTNRVKRGRKELEALWGDGAVAPPAHPLGRPYEEGWRCPFGLRPPAA